jgi:F-type H+-transporting ATPase subunit delta
MAKLDDRDRALARVYSQAMLDLAEEKGEADSLLEEMNELGRLLDSDTDLRTFLATPLVALEARHQVIERAFRGRASDVLVDSLQVINRKGRLRLLGAIVETYREAHRELRGVVDAQVQTAVPLTDGLRQRLEEAIGRFTGKKANLIERVDPSLLGGMVVEVAGERIDSSVTTALRDLRATLLSRAGQEAQRATEYLGE